MAQMRECTLKVTWKELFFGGRDAGLIDVREVLLKSVLWLKRKLCLSFDCFNHIRRSKGSI